MTGPAPGTGRPAHDRPRHRRRRHRRGSASLLARRPGAGTTGCSPTASAATRPAWLDPAPSLAARFAAKEAVMKALGVGLGAFAWRDVEVVRLEGGQPTLARSLRGGRGCSPAGRGVESWQVSLTHTDTLAEAWWSPCLTAVIPVVTTEQMKAVDAGRGRAGRGADRAGRVGRGRSPPPDLLGGAYGRRVVVVAGQGNNGADGRAAGAVLARRGVRGHGARGPRPRPRGDAAAGRPGHRRGVRHRLPRPLRAARSRSGAPVLAVDIPSGVAGRHRRGRRWPRGHGGVDRDLRGLQAGAAARRRAGARRAGRGGRHRPRRRRRSAACTTWLVDDRDVADRLPAPAPRQPTSGRRRCGRGRLSRA